MPKCLPGGCSLNQWFVAYAVDRPHDKDPFRATKGVQATLKVMSRALLPLRPQECPQRLLNIVRHRGLGRLSEEPRRGAVGFDERDTAFAPGDMSVQRRPDIVCQNALEVIVQEFNPCSADDVLHGRTPTRSLR